MSEFVNADSIAAGRSGFRPESAAMAAGRVMLGRIRALAEARADFAFETTLASRSFAPWLASLRASDDRVHLASPRCRIRMSRWPASRNASAREGMTWQMFDNADARGPRVLATGRGGQPPDIADRDGWARVLEHRR